VGARTDIPAFLPIPFLSTLNWHAHLRR